MNPDYVDTCLAQPDQSYRDTDLEPLIEKWQKKVDLLHSLFEVSVARIIKREAGQLVVLVASQNEDNPYYSGEKFDRDSGLACEMVLATGFEIAIPDFHSSFSTRTANFKLEIERGLISYIGLPLTWPNGSLFGTLCLLDHQAKVLAEKQRQLLQQFQEAINTDLLVLEQTHRLKNISKSAENLIAEEQKRGDEWRQANLPYQQMFEKSRAVMLLIDPKTGAIVDANQAAANFYGYSLSELKARKVEDFNVLSETEILEEMSRASSEQRTHFLFRHRLASGEIREVEVHSNPIQWQGQTLLYSIIHDITERQRNQKTIQSERDFALQVMEAMGQGLMVTDLEARIEFINPSYARLLGYSPTELIGKTPFDITPADEIEKLKEARQQRMAGKSTSYETRVMRPDGSQLYVLVTGVPYWRDGKITGTIAVVTDLTERRQIEEAQRQQSAYLAALHETSLDLMNRLELTDLLQVIVSRAGELVGTDHGYIYLLEPGEAEMKVRVGIGYHKGRLFSKIKPGEGLAGKIWQSGQPLAIPDYSKWNQRLSDPEHDPIRATVGLPLKSGSQVVGVLGLAYLEEGRTFAEHEIELLQGFAQLASIALDNARLYTSSQRRLSEITTVQKIAHALNSSLQLEEIFQIVMEQVKAAFGYEQIAIYLRSGDGLVLQAAIGQEHYKAVPLIMLDEGISGRVARTGEAAFLRDVSQDKDYKVWMTEIKQLIVIPLKSAKGQVLGTLVVVSTVQSRFTEDDFILLQLLGDQVGVAVENAHLFIELRRSEEKYRDVVDSVTEIIGQVDLNGNWTFLNSAWSHLLGYDLKESLGTSFVNYIYSEDREQALQVVMPIMTGKAEVGRVELRLLTKKSTTRWFQCYGKAIKDDQGTLTGITGTLVDVTERKQAEEERLQLERKLLETQKLESLGVLAGGIAHDFNNLLVGIMGNAGLALMELPSDSSTREILTEIEQASQRAAHLTRQMLAYSGQGRFVVRQIALNQLIEEMDQLLKSSVDKNVFLKYELNSGVPLIEADASQVRQVVINLVTNAADAIGQQNGIISITTGVMWVSQDYLASTHFTSGLHEGSYVYLEVTDDGVGMDAATQAKIFDPFFSTKFTGRGLGLAAVSGIVRGHKGGIRVSSTLGIGTIFRVLFPAIENPDFNPSKPNQRPSTGTGVLNNGKPTKEHDEAQAEQPTILVVDDEELVRNMTARLLQRLGYRVLTAPDGQAGVQVFREHTSEINAVLLDMVMPKLNGEDAFLEMRQIQPDTPIILMSGYSEQEATRRFVGKGLAGFLQKPYTSAILQEKLNRLLNRQLQS